MSGGRGQRVGDEIRQHLARLLREKVRDPDLGFVTVTDVEVSPDLRNARVFVSVLGEDKSTSLGALARAAPFLKRSLARDAGLRFTPQLRFLLDRSSETGFRIERLLDEEPPEGEEAP